MYGVACGAGDRPGVRPPPPGDQVWPSMPSKSSSIASRSIFSFRYRPNSAVPTGPSCPSMMFSETPLRSSFSANSPAAIRMSTVSSKLQRMRGPVSCRLMPCRVMAMRCPRYVITSHRMATWR